MNKFNQEMFIKHFLQWCKGQPVLLISFIIALISMCIIPPDSQYFSYCNRSVLIQLFCLMITVAGFRSIGVFENMTQFLLRKAGTVRRLGFLLINLCFFSSMLVTNDVALLTFVPLTLLLFQQIKDSKSLIWVIVLETVSANLGSMLTPIGNPQNLYIYAEYELNVISFLKTMLPCGILSYLCLIFLSIKLPRLPCSTLVDITLSIPKKKAFMCLFMFLFCLLTVLRIIPDWICLLVTLIFTIILNYKLFAKVDYALLGTFICFFIFVGNISRISAVQNLFSNIIQEHELIVSILLSQCISNVPATVMLSGFTQNAKSLLLGVNIGGLGTLIASLASLISYQFYSKSKGAKSGHYLMIFSLINFSMLMLLLLFTKYIQPIFIS